MIVLTRGGGVVGLGHVRRCLTLAGALRREGIGCSFHVWGEGAAFVAQQGFEAITVDRLDEGIEGAGALLIDSYKFDDRLLSLGAPTVVIDDLAARPLPADMIINPGAGAEALAYAARPDTILLLGVRYALLRSEFALPSKRDVCERIENVMITLGGYDHGTLALELLRWTAAALPAANINMIVGPFFERVNDLRAMESSKIRLVHNPQNMRDLMLRSDLAISAGGQTLYELAATGTPAVVVETAGNQRPNIEALARAGTIVYLAERTSEALADAIARVSPPEVREEMGVRGKALVDGRGAERSAKGIAGLLRRTSR
jgi:UDP-2,4-diacetamido-2,4,6-trideoxy-beta-L-altropyranose hydrolase